jgi:hypothetical protein
VSHENRTVVVAGGHLTDAPARAGSRFPEAAVGGVSAALGRALDGWGLDGGDLLLCGGARGGDILAAEAALARGMAVELLLAEPVEAFLDSSVRLEAGRPDAWETRFRRLLGSARVRIQDDELGPLRAGETRYERNNRWCVDAARAAGAAPPIRGLIVWDRLPEEGAGGTAHLATELERAGAEIVVVDPEDPR